MPVLRFHQLDVFTDQPLAGNPLAVFPEPGQIDGATMQALAREMNLSETTFITRRDEVEQAYEVRIFTPYAEVPFAGHPTVGTAWLIFDDLPPDVAQIALILRGGRVPVRIARGGERPFVYFTPPPVTLEDTVPDMELLTRLLGLEPTRLATDRMPAQFVSAGLRFLIVPVTDTGALERITVDLAALRELADDHGCSILTAFCLEGYNEDALASTRVFAPLLGVPEDPATGSSASCLTYYLRAHELIDDCGEEWLKLDQGHSIGRPSTIHLRASRETDGEITVNIGGHVVPVAFGEFML